jgi:hypothetical protein
VRRRRWIQTRRKRKRTTARRRGRQTRRKRKRKRRRRRRESGLTSTRSAQSRRATMRTLQATWSGLMSCC